MARFPKRGSCNSMVSVPSEASFGDFSKFDALVRGVFVERTNAAAEAEMAVLG